MYGSNIVEMLMDSTPPSNQIIESSAMLGLQQQQEERRKAEEAERWKQQSELSQTPRKGGFGTPLQVCGTVWI